jgi:hypothetical protein
MLINNISVNDRFTNPPELSKVGLRVFFLQDGQYFDPYQISAVSLFKASDNYSPEHLLDSEELISSSVSSHILMNFANSSADTSNVAFNPSSYLGTGQYGIYRLGIGDYVAVYDGIVDQSGVLNLFGLNQTIENTVSNIGDFIDVWTVKMFQSSEFETVINYFTLTRGNIQTLTEPIMFRTRNRLFNNTIQLGSKVDVKIGTDLTIENTALAEEVRNTIRDSVINNASIEIVKLNNEVNLPARVTVSSFADTSALTRITQGDTIVFTWDTELLKNINQALMGNLGSIKGTYYIQAKYNLFNERILSPLMHLTVE